MRFFELLSLIVLILLAIFIVFFFPLQSQEKIHENVSQFVEIEVDWNHQYTEEHPFLGGAVIDVNNDGMFEIFVGGGEGQDDALFFYDGKTFQNRIPNSLSSKEATYGVISLDIDADGDVDLIISRNNGLFFYINNNSQFTIKEIPLNLEENSVVFSVALGDVNKDGWVDLYVSTFVEFDQFKSATYNDPVHAKENILLLNKGDNSFKDITSSSGTSLDANTFLSAFIDLDSDGWQDLVIAPNTDTVHIYKNNKDLTFSEIEPPTDYGFWMGLAIGDYDKDGDQDLFFSNAGNLGPKLLFKGDLTKEQMLDLDWALLRNDGDFQFTNVNKEQGLRNLEFSWGAVMEDFNLDGYPELVVSENYIKWFAHKIRKFPGRLFANNQGNLVSATKQSGVENRHFGQSPLVVDINNDGLYDLIYLNVNGPVRAFMNRGDPKEYTLVTLPDAVSSLGAKVTLNGVTKVFTSGLGLMTDQTPQMIFPGNGKPIIELLE